RGPAVGRGAEDLGLRVLLVAGDDAAVTQAGASGVLQVAVETRLAQAPGVGHRVVELHAVVVVGGAAGGPEVHVFAAGLVEAAVGQDVLLRRAEAIGAGGQRDPVAVGVAAERVGHQLDPLVQVRAVGQDAAVAHQPHEGGRAAAELVHWGGHPRARAGVRGG